jgi:hypothetical protein
MSNQDNHTHIDSVTSYIDTESTRQGTAIEPVAPVGANPQLKYAAMAGSAIVLGAVGLHFFTPTPATKHTEDTVKSDGTKSDGTKSDDAKSDDAKADKDGSEEESAGKKDEPIKDAHPDIGAKKTESAPIHEKVVVHEDAPLAHTANDNMSFGQAFAHARHEVGPGGVFAWHGQYYNTYYREEWAAMTPAQHKEYAASLHDLPHPANYHQLPPDHNPNVPPHDDHQPEKEPHDDHRPEKQPHDGQDKDGQDKDSHHKDGQDKDSHHKDGQDKGAHHKDAPVAEPLHKPVHKDTDSIEQHRPNTSAPPVVTHEPKEEQPTPHEQGSRKVPSEKPTEPSEKPTEPSNEKHEDTHAPVAHANNGHDTVPPGSEDENASNGQVVSTPLAGTEMPHDFAAASGIAVDTDDDGVIDAKMITDDQGTPHEILLDADHNNVIEAALYDTDNDGKADHYAFDNDQNGTQDEEGIIPPETHSQESEIPQQQNEEQQEPPVVATAEPASEIHDDPYIIIAESPEPATETVEEEPPVEAVIYDEPIDAIPTEYNYEMTQDSEEASAYNQAEETHFYENHHHNDNNFHEL